MQLRHRIPQFVLIGFFILALACSRDATETSTVSITFPNLTNSLSASTPNAASAMTTSGGETSWNSQVPTDISEMDCFAVFVGAIEPALSGSSCKNGNSQEIMRFGPATGLFAKGETAIIEVPAGPQRTIYIAGTHKVNGFCEKVVNLQNITISNYTRPYKLGSTTKDLEPGTTTLDIVLQNSFSISNVMADCTFMQNAQPYPSPTGSPTPNPSASPTPSPSPSPSPTPNPTAIQVATAYQHVCALLSSGDVKCWGQNSYGQLGLGDTNNRGDNANEMGANLPYVNLNGTAIQIAVGAAHSCAMMSGGTVKCWGKNDFGQLGQGDTTNRGDNANEMGANLPAISLGTGFTTAMIASGNYFTCAMSNAGAVKCWGTNSYGQLGQGTSGGGTELGDGSNEMGDNLSALSLGAGRTAVYLSAGVNNACVILDDQSVKCWGDGASGAIGDGSSTMRTTPTQVSGFGASSLVTNIENGYGTSCAVLSTGSVKCWGPNSLGTVGDGTTTDRLTPVNVLTSSINVSVGNQHACAKKVDNTLMCWGSNGNGAVGIENTSNQLSPVAVVAIGAVTSFSLGNDNTCAIDSSGVKCWGLNSYGQLGQRNTTRRGSTTGSMTFSPISLY